MSISDLIVVMKEGVIQQIGKPQEVYDQPGNLFVAQFLGTPPINVFRARVEQGQLMVGDEAVLAVEGVEDRAVVAAIRPEGFVPDEKGGLTCRLVEVEVMGRDITVVCDHPDCENVEIRAIVSAEDRPEIGGETVRFALKGHKVFLFDPESGERLHFRVRQ